MFRKVAFTMYPVVDMARARAFYEDTLGLPTGTGSTERGWVEFDLPGGGCLAITIHAQNDPSAAAGGTIAFEVDDLDALILDLQAKGVAILTPDLIHSPVCRMSVIKDSEGNSILLHQLKPKAAA
jgi:predicted enzyme related to lactoylglutathione lyase